TPAPASRDPRGRRRGGPTVSPRACTAARRAANTPTTRSDAATAVAPTASTLQSTVIPDAGSKPLETPTAVSGEAATPTRMAIAVAPAVARSGPANPADVRPRRPRPRPLRITSPAPARAVRRASAGATPTNAVTAAAAARSQTVHASSSIAATVGALNGAWESTPT